GARCSAESAARWHRSWGSSFLQSDIAARPSAPEERQIKCATYYDQRAGRERVDAVGRGHHGGIGTRRAIRVRRLCAAPECAIAKAPGIHDAAARTNGRRKV